MTYSESGQSLFSEYPEKQTRTEFVLNQILAGIRSGRLPPQAKLPAETKLAEQMDVARGAVREALSALSVMGVVERRVGDGTYIRARPPDEQDATDAVDAIHENKRFPEIWHARRILETVLIEIAVTKALPENIRRVRESFERIAASAERGSFEDYALADYDFHVSLAQATRNPFLSSALFPLLEITHLQLSTRLNDGYVRSHWKHLAKEHRAILRAVELGSVRYAARIIDLHFAATESLFQKEADKR